MPDYTSRLLAAFENGKNVPEIKTPANTTQPLIEPLSSREMEVLTIDCPGAFES